MPMLPSTKSLSCCPKFIEFALTCQASALDRLWLTDVGLVLSTPAFHFHDGSKPVEHMGAFEQGGYHINGT